VARSACSTTATASAFARRAACARRRATTRSSRRRRCAPVRVGWLRASRVSCAKGALKNTINSVSRPVLRQRRAGHVCDWRSLRRHRFVQVRGQRRPVHDRRQLRLQVLLACGRRRAGDQQRQVLLVALRPGLQRVLDWLVHGSHWPDVRSAAGSLARRAGRLPEPHQGLERQPVPALPVGHVEAVHVGRALLVGSGAVRGEHRRLARSTTSRRARARSARRCATPAMPSAVSARRTSASRTRIRRCARHRLQCSCVGLVGRDVPEVQERPPRLLRERGRRRWPCSTKETLCPAVNSAADLLDAPHVPLARVRDCVDVPGWHVGVGADGADRRVRVGQGDQRVPVDRCTSVSKGWNGLACERYTTDHPGYCSGVDGSAPRPPTTRAARSTRRCSTAAPVWRALPSFRAARSSAVAPTCANATRCDRRVARPCASPTRRSRLPGRQLHAVHVGLGQQRVQPLQCQPPGLVLGGHVVRHVSRRAARSPASARWRRSRARRRRAAIRSRASRMRRCRRRTRWPRRACSTRRRGLQSADDGAVQQVPHRLERAHVRALQPRVVGSLRRQRCVHHDVRRDSVADDCAARVVRQRRLHSSDRTCVNGSNADSSPSIDSLCFTDGARTTARSAPRATRAATASTSATVWHARNDIDCYSGFCVKPPGVCCNRRCSNECEECLLGSGKCQAKTGTTCSFDVKCTTAIKGVNPAVQSQCQRFQNDRKGVCLQTGVCGNATDLCIGSAGVALQTCGSTSCRKSCDALANVTTADTLAEACYVDADRPECDDIPCKTLLAGWNSADRTRCDKYAIDHPAIATRRQVLDERHALCAAPVVRARSTSSAAPSCQKIGGCHCGRLGVGQGLADRHLRREPGDEHVPAAQLHDVPQGLVGPHVPEVRRRLAGPLRRDGDVRARSGDVQCDDWRAHIRCGDAQCAKNCEPGLSTLLLNRTSDVCQRERRGGRLRRHSVHAGRQGLERRDVRALRRRQHRLLRRRTLRVLARLCRVHDDQRRRRGGERTRRAAAARSAAALAAACRCRRLRAPTVCWRCATCRSRTRRARRCRARSVSPVGRARRACATRSTRLATATRRRRACATTSAASCSRRPRRRWCRAARSAASAPRRASRTIR
jgi:hypothetical protein